MVDVSSYLEKAHESYDKGDFDEGLRHLDVILKDRNFIGTLYNKALFLKKLRKHEAIEWFNKILNFRMTSFFQILDIEPRNVYALSFTGLCIANLAKYEQAMAYFDKALDVDRNNVLALYYEGLALDSLRRYKEAIEYYDKTLAIDPNNVLF